MPLFVGIALLMFVAMAIFSNLTETIGMPTIIALSVVSIVCFVLVKVISTATKKKLMSQTTVAPTCVAKKIVGNDNALTYICIYTAEEHRHDEAFIERIAEKILIAISNPQSAANKEVANFFRPDFLKPNEFAKTLPLTFTEQVKVWCKQVSFVGTSTALKQNLIDEQDKFAMVAIVPENARLLLDYYN
ncbi:hypothetical protein [Pedobacter sp. SL55]|uniref:hypothetical protein n=1 Tax=Pedobacter sp. SL55 TaxID=2995161 RepID=UPI0022705B04|nr:hypothetical protein [Pedobacter sp. SL55]WAC42581.1 hypothetical protein OVA16_09565 [Pedobacter sp. SL55]